MKKFNNDFSSCIVNWELFHKINNTHKKTLKLFLMQSSEGENMKIEYPFPWYLKN